MLAFLRRRWLPLAAVVLLAGGGAYGYTAYGKAQAEKKAEAEKVAAKAFDTPYAAIANGKADVEGGVISVAARRSGIVREVYVQEGQTVRKGQILARQEDDEPRLAVQRAAAEVAQARSTMRMTQVQRTTAAREYERLQKLVDRNFVAGSRVDGARDKIAEAEATLGSQSAAVATAQARLNEAQFNLEQTQIRAPADGRIVRRYANPGSGASTLNVSNMFDLEPNTPRIVRAEISEAALPAVVDGQEVEIVPEADETKVYVGRVLRRSAMFGARKLQSDDPSERTDERVVEVVVTADGAPLLIGQRVLVKFMKPGRKAGAQRAAPEVAEATEAKAG
jgi:HlyD family secretion protein